VVYPGTHDNETLVGWLDHILPEEREEVRAFTGLDGHSGDLWAYDAPENAGQTDAARGRSAPGAVHEKPAQGDPAPGEREKAAAVRKAAADAENAEVIPVCAGIEAEIAELEPEEKKMFLADMGIDESGLDRLIKASYSLLGYISYLTAGPKEVRAWTIVNGTKAPQAAGKIHSDFERGFIRAEIVAFDDLMACGSMNAAKEKGLVRSEGKEYVIHDGDVVLFRFNV
jgi:hypothetical protein